MFRRATAAATLVLAAGPALAAAPTSFGIESSLPGPDDAVWPADGRVVLTGEAFDPERLTVTVDGAPARLVEEDALASGRAFRVEPAPAEGATVRVEGTPYDPAKEGAGPFAATWTAGPPEAGGMLAPPLPVAFDLYDHGYLTDFACGPGAGATVWLRVDEPALPAAQWAVVLVNGERVRDGRLRLFEDAFTFPEEASPGEVCVETFVESASGDRGPVTRTCTPCRVRVDDWVPEFLPPPPPGWATANPEACLGGEDLAVVAVPVAPAPEDDDAGDGAATQDEPADGGCQAAPGAGPGLPFALAFFALRRRRR